MSYQSRYPYVHETMEDYRYRVKQSETAKRKRSPIVQGMDSGKGLGPSASSYANVKAKVGPSGRSSTPGAGLTAGTNYYQNAQARSGGPSAGSIQRGTSRSASNAAATANKAIGAIEQNRLAKAPGRVRGEAAPQAVARKTAPKAPARRSTKQPSQNLQQWAQAYTPSSARKSTNEQAARAALKNQNARGSGGSRSPQLSNALGRRTSAQAAAARKR